MCPAQATAGRRSHGRRPLLCALAVLGLLGLSATPALAVRGHVFSSAFGKAGTGEGEFNKPLAIAVNEATNDVYVLDQGNNRVEYFSATGSYLGQFNGSGTFAGEHGAKAPEPLSAPEGIAVDNSCVLKKLTGSACTAADPSNGDVYVITTVAGHQVIDKFNPEGAFLHELTGTVCLNKSGCKETEKRPLVPYLGAMPFEGLRGVATGPDGSLSVGEEGAELLKRVDQFSNEPENAFQSDIKLGGFLVEVAVGCDNALYVRLFHGTSAEEGAQYVIAQFNPAGSPINGQVDPELLASGVAVEGQSCDVYVDDGGTVGRFTDAVPAKELERFGAPGVTEGVGLAVDGADEQLVYVANPTSNAIEVFTLEPPRAPTVTSPSVAEVTADSATLSAEANPHGAESEYSFEYGRCATAETCAASEYQPTPPGVLAAGFETTDVRAPLPALQADTVYHARAVIHSKLGSAVSKEVLFTTDGTASFELPDGRSWELVSPPDKHGADLETDSLKGEMAIEAAAGGGAITYLATAPTEPSPEGFSNWMQVLSTKTAGGWRSHDIGIPHGEATGQPVGEGLEYRMFSPELTDALVEPLAGFDPALSPAASEQTPYLRTDYVGGDSEVECRESCYAPLVAGCPAAGEPCPEEVERYADVPPGTRFSTTGKCPQETTTCAPRLQGATPDLSHVVMSSETALTETPVANGLYERGGGALKLLSRLPAGEGGGTRPGVLGGPQSGERKTAAISDDGSRVIWTLAPVSGLNALYMRDTEVGSEETLRLDAPQGGSGAGRENPVFQGAASDGSKVLFTDEQRLTGDSGAASEKPDLYECEVVVEAQRLVCRLTDLTPLGAGGESARVQHAVLGTSKDGSWVYFVAWGALATNAGEMNEKARPGAENLYVNRAGVTTFIATLAAGDAPDWGGTEGIDRKAYEITARVSPDGAWLGFMSGRSLTGYDNRDLVTGNADEEVYLYNGETARLVCASCNPTGERPTGALTNRDQPLGVDALATGRNGFWPEGTGLAANVPGWATPSYQPRYLSDSGRLFLNSHEPLVPQDVNGTWDAYQYEPPGLGSCTSGAATFSPRSNGCVDLISSGTSAEESAFVDASETGGDVFFATSARLAPQDKDTALDIYDAHECTASVPCLPAPPASPPACISEASCRPAPTPQPEIFGAPSSAMFAPSVSFNVLTPPVPAKPATTADCKRGFVKSHGRCVKRPTAPKRCKRGYLKSHGRCVKSRKGKASSLKRAGR